MDKSKSVCCIHGMPGHSHHVPHAKPALAPAQVLITERFKAQNTVPGEDLKDSWGEKSDPTA